MTHVQPPTSQETAGVRQERSSSEQLVHDLNNALMAALGSLGMIQYTLDPESPAAPYVSTLERAIQRMSARVAAFEQEESAHRPQ